MATPTTFIGYIFSLKRIIWTLLINLGAAKFYYSVFYEPDTWFVGKTVIALLIIFVTAILMGYWMLAYKAFRAKQNRDMPIGR